jgi:quercetin dioxygenase-like cupin family protein
MNIRIITATAALLSNFGLAQHAHAIDPTAVAAIADAIPQVINPAELKWEKTIPSAGATSPEYAILHVDPKTHLTMLMFRTPVPVHIKAHTHKLAETHVVLAGATHVFEANGIRYNIEKGGYLRMPGGVVHEAWLPAGSQTLNIEESGWVVNWLHGGPSEEDIGQSPPGMPRH